MKAKILVYALLALNLADIHLAEAQQGKVFHVGVLTIGDNPVHNCFVGRPGYVPGLSKLSFHGRVFSELKAAFSPVKLPE